MAALGGRLRRAASRGVQRVVAALVAGPSDGVDVVDAVDRVGADVDVGDVGDVVAGEVGDEELYKPEETVRGKRAKRKVEKLAAGTGAASGTKPTKRTTKNTEAGEASKAVQKKRARYRVPDLVERAFYEAGSVILGQLSMLIGDTLSSIRECKVLLDMGLVSGDAFAEVFGGRPDHLKMRKADLKRLVQSAGIRGLASGSLEEMRSDPRSRALAFLSVDNYHLWLNAEESELLASFKSSVLPGEPAWLESLINKRTDVFDVYRTALEKKLHVPKPILESMEYFTSCIQISTGWRRSFEQTTYLYRASVAISVAVRWRAFKGLKELDISKIVSENSDMRSSLDTEGRVRKEILARADQVRKQWKKAGVNLDATLSSGHFPERFPVTEKFLLDGGADNLSKSVLAAQTRVKYNIPDEQEASRFHAKMTRFTSLSAALLKLKLTVSSELDPSADPADERVSKVRKELDVSWPWVCGGTGRVEVAVDAHKAWLEFGNVPSVSNESSAKVFCSKVARFTLLSAALLKLKLTVPSELDPRADPADERVSKVRKELDVSWPWVCGGTGRVEVAVDAHKAWLEFGNVPSVSNESSAKVFCSKVARFTSLSAALLKLKLTVPSELDPRADPADERVSKVRKELDVSWPWVCGGTGRVEVAVDAHKAWLEFGNVPSVSNESSAKLFCSKVARFTLLSAALLKLKLTVLSELDPRADPADERVSKVRKELDVSWPWVCGGTGRVEVAVDAHKAWLEFGNVPSVSNESSAKLFCSKVARFTSLSAALLKLKLTVPSELDPRADPADERVSKVRKELDVSWPWVCGGTGRVEVAVDAHKAWLEFGNVPAVASEVCAMKYARLEDVRREWRKHQLEDVDMLSINMTDELAEKYGVTKDYIDGNLIGNAKSLASALNARLAMRDAKLDSECPSLKIDDFPRQPGENHVYICPCGYRAGRFKMECHVRKNSGNAVRAHKTGY